MSLVKGEECMLLDNSRRTRWRVRNSSGVEALMPAICFYIPPPNKDAEELAKTCVQHHMHSIHATYCCRCLDVLWSVCGLSVYHNHQPCKNGWTSEDGMWTCGAQGTKKY